ncbi:hypothetical protein PGC08_12480 [Brevibacterium sp. BDJS002]|uniref:hypothetical protein n=1 Tax=Brevibacterium sp. BDJS002 TaxID=3020906 RepID=UPI00230708F6|nr:hypothetical protein [Brevibacterium sp. BDJS002]WCE38823.1 hypothetical protein PGC08_12480 [Brevibacterium sp. BDJS002]
MINVKPRPRILFEDVPDDVFERMKVYAPSHLRITSAAHSLNNDVHASDWDLLVTYAPEVEANRIRHALSFGATSLGAEQRARKTHAAELAVWQDAPNSITRLVRKTVAPVIVDGEKDYWIRFQSSFRSWAVLNSADLYPGFPLLTVGEEQFVLAFWNSSAKDEVRHIVSLPRETLNPELWLLELISVLQIEDAEHFPPGTSWRDGAGWAPSALRSAYKRVEALKQERDDVVARFDAELTEAEGQVEREKALAEQGEWRLLTENGEQLVAAVMSALEVLGLDAEDRDSTTSGAKLEDLRVRDSSRPDWICLVEVKGYTRGAKSSEVNQVAMNPATQFALEFQREPDKLWHIVNGNKDVAPESRGPTFTDPEKVIAHFASLGGLVIDTRDLFRATRAVADGEVDAAAVKHSLWTSSGVWTGIDGS